MTGPRLHTPDLPWLPPRTKTFYVCASGRPHRDGDICTCTPRSP